MNKKLAKIFAVLVSLFIFLGIAAPATALAVEVPAGPYTLTLHKVQYNTSALPDTLISNQGTELSNLPDGITKLLSDQVQFTIYKVADTETSLVAPASTPTAVMYTDAGGVATFTNLTAGRYLVVETAYPNGVETFTPNFLVDVPMINSSGTSWLTNVHVYPKNQLILGNVELTKTFEGDSISPYPVATFDLYESGETTPIGTYTTNPLTGKINVTNLPVGNYYFIETAAPTGYGLNSTQMPFTITLDDHGVTKHLSRKNYLLPTGPMKTVSADSSNINGIMHYTLSVPIPSDVNSYTLFNFTDVLSNYLTFMNDISAVASKEGTTSSNITFTNDSSPSGTAGGTLDINLSLAELSTFAGGQLQVTFAAKINDSVYSTAIGMDIANYATLKINNGSQLLTYDTNTVNVHTSGKQFTKQTSTGTPLAGAQFVVRNDAGEYLQNDWSWGAQNTARLFTSAATTGLIDIAGLADGVYYLIENTAPAGYNLLTAPIPFTVTQGSYAAAPAAIHNGFTLPSTGGFGTILFTVLGTGLMGGGLKFYRKNRTGK